jgi:hypothetical protein
VETVESIPQFPSFGGFQPAVFQAVQRKTSQKHLILIL